MAGVDKTSERCLNNTNIRKIGGIGGRKKILKSNGTKEKNYTKDIINNTIKFYVCMKKKCTSGCKTIGGGNKKKCTKKCNNTQLDLWKSSMEGIRNRIQKKKPWGTTKDEMKQINALLKKIEGKKVIFSLGAENPNGLADRKKYQPQLKF